MIIPSFTYYLGIHYTDYNDLHHLSETEFYSRLERLKIQQQELMDMVLVESSASLTLRQKSDKKTTMTNSYEPDSQPKLIPHSSSNRDHLMDYLQPSGEVHSTPDQQQAEDCNSMGSIESSAVKALPRRPTSSLQSKTKKSVRISSGTTTCKTDFSDFYDEFADANDESLRINVTSLNARSKSASPNRTRRSLTVPKPFKMTQR